MKKYFLYISLLLLICALCGYYVWRTYYPMAETVYAMISIIAFLIASLILLVLWLKGVTSQRVFSYGTNTVIMIIGMITILSLINYINYRHSYRQDFTSNKRFSISDQTEKVVKKLDKNLRIMAFYQETDGASKRNLEDLVKEYTHINQKITVEFIDPVKNPTKALKYGIKQADTVILELSSDKKEKLSGKITEQSLTNAIMKLTNAKVKIAYFLTGHNEISISKEFSKAKDALEKETFTVKELFLLKDLKIPDDCSVLIIGAPEKELLKPEIDAIDGYLKKGGKVLVMVEPTKADLKDFLKTWNIDVEKDIVLDFSGIGQQLFGANEAMPIAANYPEHEITKNMKTMATIYPIARSVTPVSSGAVQGINTAVLVESLPESWSYRGPMDTNDKPKIDKTRDKKGPVPMAVAVTSPVKGDEKEPNPINPQEVKNTKETRMIVVGNSRFAQNDFLSFQGNGDMFLNMIGWLAQEEDLISIRPKNPEVYQMNLTGSQTILVFFVSIILLPLTLIICGISVWFYRR